MTISGEPTTPAEPPATTNVDAIVDRLTAAADDLEAKREAVTPALELRDELIVAAHEAGLSYSEVARAARCSRATVFGVVASH